MERARNKFRWLGGWHCVSLDEYGYHQVHLLLDTSTRLYFLALLRTSYKTVSTVRCSKTLKETHLFQNIEHSEDHTETISTSTLSVYAASRNLFGGKLFQVQVNLRFVNVGWVHFGQV